MKVASRPFKAKQYGKCPIKNGTSEHHTINIGDIIVRLETGVKWTEKRASIGMHGKCFNVQCSTDYAHAKCLEERNENETE